MEKLKVIELMNYHHAATWANDFYYYEPSCSFYRLYYYYEGAAGFVKNSEKKSEKSFFRKFFTVIFSCENFRLEMRFTFFPIFEQNGKALSIFPTSFLEFSFAFSQENTKGK